MFLKFVVKSSFVVGASILFFLGMIFGIPVFKKKQIVSPLEFNATIKDASVIVCGDSRADRQINPVIIKSKTNLNVINIAASGQDLYTWSLGLQQARISNKTIIISASFFQINDGANEFPFFNLATFADMDFIQKVEMYRYNVYDLILMQAKYAFNILFGKKLDDIFGNFDRRINIDYTEKKCTKFDISKEWFTNHSWYKTPVLNGVKLKILKKALSNISKLNNCNVLIYNGPVSESFVKFSEDILLLERDYDNIMYKLCEQYNIDYVSFLDDVTLRADRLYYDPQHMCSTGAIEFSNKIADMLLSIYKQ